MSAMAQKGTFQRPHMMSALPSKADIASRSATLPVVEKTETGESRAKKPRIAPGPENWFEDFLLFRLRGGIAGWV
jgi:hypothetical protein